MISIRHISKSFDTVEALKDVSIEIQEGELFGLIGPDGAGKTTLFRILTTLLLPDSGEANVAGQDVRKDYMQIRSEVGYMPGRFSLYPDLSIEENLSFFATVFGTSIAENYDLIKDIYSHIEPFKNRKAGALSGGMKQKLALSCALIHHPKVLFMDEPTTGIDPVSRKELWDMLKKLKAKNITILVSTPYMDEAVMCDRVALMQHGEVMAIDKPENISGSFRKTLYAIQTNQNMHKLLHDLLNYPDLGSAYPFGESVHFTFREKESDDETLKNYLHRKGHAQIVIKTIPPTIEDRFIELIKKDQDVQH